MSHGHTKIQSKGACIYCGRSDVKLTDEHIVPLSLGGFHIILEASCRDCNKVTSKFELDVARNLWGDARTSYNAPSRRKKRRSTHISLTDPVDRSKKLNIPFCDYPAPMIFYQMSRAGILQGFPESFDLSGQWLMKAIVDDDKLQKFEQEHPGKLTAKFKHVPHSFAQLIAKIGYGQALSALDLGDFRPICLPYILGEKQNISFVVGGQSTIPKPHKDMGYVLETGGFGSLEHTMIVSTVRLIANSHTPVYHVIVGDVAGRENVNRVLEKLGVSSVELLPTTTLALQKKLSKGCHWMPSVWPLPTY